MQLLLFLVIIKVMAFCTFREYFFQPVFILYTHFNIHIYVYITSNSQKTNHFQKTKSSCNQQNERIR